MPDIRQNIDERDLKCLPSQSTHPSVHKLAIQQEHQHSDPGGPLVELSSDLFQQDGRNYILVVDHYYHVINVLTIFFAENDSPLTFYSDKGPQHTSSDFNEFSEDCEFRHCTPSLHHHRSNGIVDRLLRVVKDLMTRCRTRVAFYKGVHALRLLQSSTVARLQFVNQAPLCYVAWPSTYVRHTGLTLVMLCYFRFASVMKRCNFCS